jgi:Flp pilus assembly protein TadD
VFADALRAHADSRPRDAEAGYRAVLAADEHHEGALRFLGLLLARRSELADAINGLPRGADTEPRPGDAQYEIATALTALDRAHEAETALRRALDADATHAPALILLATLLRERKQLDEAVALARRAVTVAPSWAAYNQLGLGLAAQERVVEAATALRRAAELAPNESQVLLNLGNVYLAMSEYRKAWDVFAHAARLEPQSAGVQNNLAVSALGMGQFARAAAASERAIAFEPDHARFRYNLAFSLLGQGQLRRGWELFDLGFAAGGRAPDRTFPVPLWDGAAMPDGTLMVWREQGVGDEIRLASCIPELSERVGNLIIETDPRLVSLFARSFPASTVRPQTAGPETPDFDAHCPIASLPRHLRPTLAAFPDRRGYLSVDKPRAARWEERLARLGPGLKVGISWRSMNLAVSRLSHYTTLDEWAPVLDVAGVQFVNLQYGPVEQLVGELDSFEDRSGVVIHRWEDVDYTDDFEEVAALIAALDLVVGVGTTPALLAGALGRPVWMLALPDPLALGQADYPWFPSMRRFERCWDGSWQPQMKRVAALLRAEAS